MKIAALLPSAPPPPRPFKFRLDFRLSRTLLIIFQKFVSQILTGDLIQDITKHALTTEDN